MLNDFGDVVRDACEQGTSDTLLAHWNADLRITVSWDPKPVTVSANAFSRALSGKDSLEYITDLVHRRHREVPFACVFDEDRLRVERVFRGTTGSHGFCDWEKGPLLHTAREAAREQGLRMSLGHTHPKGYGAICSAFYWTRKELKKYPDAACQEMLSSGIYKTWGGDYAEMYVRTQIEPLVSQYFWILSPRENQAGVFEILSRGRVRYHPWHLETL